MRILSETVLNVLYALSGLGIGVVCMIIVYFVNKHYGKKKRIFDERQQQITNQAKAASWNITFIVLLVAWAVVIIFEGISFSFFLMAVLYILHCFSLIFTTTYFTKKN